MQQHGKESERMALTDVVAFSESMGLLQQFWPWQIRNNALGHDLFPAKDGDGVEGRARCR